MPKTRLAAALLASAALAACAAGPASGPQFTSEGMPLGRLSSDVTPTRYGLDLTIDPDMPTFSGVVTIGVLLAEPAEEIWLHGGGLEVSEVKLVRGDGVEIPGQWEQRNDTGSALVTLDRAASRGPANLVITYTAPFDTSSDALFREERDGRWYAATQFEPISARRAFPSLDEPGFKVPFDIVVTAREGDLVVTNTPETAVAPAGPGWSRHSFAPTDPLPTYLIAFAVGPYETMEATLTPNAVRAEPLPLRGVAVAGAGDRLAYALDNTERLLDALEIYFGRPYPYEKLDLIAMPSSFGGAMENAAAITYDEFIILMDEQSPLRQRRIYTYVHAHELAHMWFGDLVTPEWWDDIWLNEAFASWMMYKISDEAWPEGEFDRDVLKDALGAMREDSLISARRIREPVIEDAETADIFDAITYEKGGGVIAMMESYLGEETMREGVRLHINRFADSTATSDDFMASIAEAAGQSEVVAAFESFLDQPGVPLVEASLSCEAGRAPEVSLRQSRYRPLGSEIDADGQSWRIPACIAWEDQDGAAGRTCEMITEREQSVPLETSSCPTQIHPNADGAGYYRFALDEGGWDALTADASALSAREALVMVDSLDASFRAGATSADDFVEGMAALTAHPAWDVTLAAVDALVGATAMFDESEIDPIRPKLGRLVRERYAAVAGATEGGDLLLKTRLAQGLALTAEDDSVRGPMTAAAAERIGIRAVPDWSHVEPDLLPATLAVGVRELGSNFFDLVLNEALASSDPQLRQASFAALAGVEDPALAARLRAALLEDGFRGPEAIGVVAGLLGRDATREATWAWVKENADAVIALPAGSFRGQQIANLGSSFCSAEEREEIRSFVLDHAGELPGYERSLAQVEERISLCAALKEAAADDLLAALGRLPG